MFLQYDRQASIGWVKGLLPNERQDITWNNVQWNVNQNEKRLLQEMHLKISEEWQQFCEALIVLLQIMFYFIFSIIFNNCQISHQYHNAHI